MNKKTNACFLNLGLVGWVFLVLFLALSAYIKVRNRKKFEVQNLRKKRAFHSRNLQPPLLPLLGSTHPFPNLFHPVFQTYWFENFSYPVFYSSHSHTKYLFEKKDYPSHCKSTPIAKLIILTYLVKYVTWIAFKLFKLIFLLLCKEDQIESRLLEENKISSW